MNDSRMDHIEDILDGDRKRRRDESDQHHMTSPDIGCITRTLVHTRHVNFIFHAQLRSREHNDLVHVGDDRVVLSQIDGDGIPHFVGITDAFDSKIRTAAISPNKIPDDLGLDRLNIESDDDREEILSPQLLVLALEAGNLHFITFENEPQGSTLQYHESVLMLPRLPNLELPGAYLAIDPLNRALAVAAHHDTIILYKLKSKEQSEADFEHDPSTWSPVCEDSVISVNAGIVKIEFLHPGVDGNQDQVLLLVVTTDGRSSRLRLSVYEWDHSNHIRSNHAVVKGLQLGSEYRLPQLIIPSGHSPSFIWVADQEIRIFENILSETPDHSPVNISPKIMSTLDRSCGRSEEFPLFTQWSKARRDHPQYIEDKGEMFYLVREDGCLFSISMRRRVNHLSKIGHLEGNGSTAFACFTASIGHAAPDMLISLSDDSPGEILSIDRRRVHEANRTSMSPYVESKPLNWGPILSATSFPTKKPTDGASRSHESIIFTSNTQPFGAVSELRRGCTAQIVDRIRLYDPVLDPKSDDGGAAADLAKMRAANGLFILNSGDEQGDTIVISMPDETLIFGMGGTDNPVGMLSYELSAAGYGGPHVEVESLLVARGPVGHVVQVCREHMTGLGFSKLMASSKTETGESTSVGSFQKPFRISHGTAAVVVSAVYHELLAAVIVVTQTRGPQYAMQIYPLPHEPIVNVGFGMPRPIVPVGIQRMINKNGRNIYPTCSTTFTAQGHAAFAVALQDGSIALCLILEKCKTTEPVVWEDADDRDRGKKLQARINMIESMAVISRSTTSSESGTLLLCGLRDGEIKVFELSFTQKEDVFTPELRFLSRCRLGFVSVKFAPQDTSDGTDQPFAVAACGADLVRIEFGATSHLSISINSLWVWDQHRQSDQQPVVSVMHLKKRISPTGDSVYRLHLLSDEILTIADIDNEIKTVPRRVNLEHAIYNQQAGTPRIIIYSDKFDTFVVATNIWSARGAGQAQGQRADSSEPPKRGSRYLLSGICFVRAHGSDVYSDEAFGDPVPVLPLRQNEKIMAMKMWTGLKDDFLILGLAVERENSPPIGRLMFIRIRADADGNIEAKFIKADKLRDPVRAISVFDNAPDIPLGGRAGTSKLAIASGTELSIYGVVVDPDNPENQKFSRLCNATLTSPAIQITCKSPWIHISTEKDSIQSWQFQIITGEGFSTYSLTKKIADTLPGRSTCHLVHSPEDPSDHSIARPWPSEAEASASTREESDFPLGLIFSAERNGTIKALSPQAQRNSPALAKQLFEARLSSPIMSLVQGNFRPPWRRIKHQGILIDDVIGCALDGSIHSLMIVDRPSRILLKFLENLVKWDRCRTRPTPRGIYTTTTTNNNDEDKLEIITIDPCRDIQVFGQEKPRRNWINGDLLQRFVGSSNGRLLLLGMLTRDWGEDDLQQRYRGNHREVRVGRFIEIVMGVCGLRREGDGSRRDGKMDEGGDVEMDLEMDLEGAVDACLLWLEDVLNPVF